eukprot:scaffold1261_cov78-Skeletonema_dohrnii-CCMP3373.AAC.3
MQAPTVIDLLLNFLAMEFVSQLDDVVFVLTKEGFMGRTLQKEAKKICSTFYIASHRSADSRAASFVTKAYFIYLLTIMLSLWGYVVWNQKNGKYMCSQVYAQYSDDVAPMLGAFTGFFFLHKQLSFGFGGFLSYINDHDGGPLLAYCQQQERWTISLPKVTLTKDGERYKYDPCDWIAKTEAQCTDFDVLTTSGSKWVVRTQTEHIVPLSQHFLTCFDCQSTDNFCGEYGVCQAEKYDGHECKCDPGRYGLRCEYEPCKRLGIESGEGFVKRGGPNHSYFASKYYLLEGGEAYNRPVYTNLGENQTFSDDVDFILFTGVRWILSYKSLFPELEDVNDVDGLVRYFSTFHGHFSNYSASYVSEPVQIDSHLDEMASPLGVRWLHSSASGEVFDQQLQPDLQKGSIETSFVCAVCNKRTNPCLFEAVCQLNGTCA